MVATVVMDVNAADELSYKSSIMETRNGSSWTGITPLSISKRASSVSGRNLNKLISSKRHGKMLNIM